MAWWVLVLPQHPKTAAVMGTIYLAGRIHYAMGYQTGDPSKRMQGAYVPSSPGRRERACLSLLSHSGVGRPALYIHFPICRQSIAIE